MATIPRLREVIDRMREVAPRYRGTGPYASDATYNRTLQDADYLEEIEQELIRLRVVARMADRILVSRETNQEKSNGNEE